MDTSNTSRWWTGLFIALDGLILLASVYYGVALRYVMGRPSEYGEVLPLYPRALTYMLIMLAILGMLGVYKRAVGQPYSRWLFRYLAAFVAGAVLMLLVGHVVHRLFLGRGSIALITIMGFSVSVGIRYLMDRLYFHHSVRT